MSARCTECKCCDAQDGFEFCVFCEDGVACPNSQRAVRPVVTTTPAPLTPLVPKKPGRPKNPNSPWRGMASLRLSDKSPASRPAEYQFPRMAEFASIQVPTAGKDLQEEKEITVKRNVDEEIPRYCGREGCTKTLTRANKSGFCTKHFYDSVKKSKESAAAAAPRSQRTPPRNSTARVETPNNGIATICVTESHMDNFWSKLSLEEKATLFQRQLEGA
jgi:hypothetical protein